MRRDHDRDLLLPPRARETFVAAAGGTWRVLTAGPRDAHDDGVPVLLVHGGGSDHAGISWYRALGDLGEDRRVLAPDLPGFGGTRGVEVLGSPAAMAAQLVELLDALRIERVVGIGVSMGGDVVLNLCLHHPDRVAALVPVAPGGLIAQFRGPILHRLVWLLTLLPDRVVMPLSDAASGSSARVLKATVADVDALPAQVAEEFVAASRTRWAGYGYWRYNKASIGPTGMRNDLTGLVAAIDAPTLFLHSPDDPLVPITGSRHAAEAMPDARLVEVPGVWHWLPLEAPARFRGEVHTFLSERGL